MRSSLLTDLPADGPHPDLADGLMDFGQFVGAWELMVRFYADDGTVVFDRPGTWTFGWVLDGRAVQDVLIYPASDGTPAGEPGRRGIGTTLRFLYPESRRWEVYWLGAGSGTIVVLHGGRDGADLELHSEPERDGTLNIWRFSEITPTGFVWTGHESADGGATWKLRQQMTAFRQS